MKDFEAEEGQGFRGLGFYGLRYQALGFRAHGVQMTIWVWLCIPQSLLVGAILKG